MIYMNYLQIEFETLNEGEAEMLVALLAEAGFENFEERESSLLAFTKEEGFLENSLGDILQIVPVNYAIAVIPEENWNAKWESSFEPIKVNNFVAIRAEFHQPINKVKHEIIITPKMSFGTGHHATTFMMIEQMEALGFAEKTVVDYGTGTAVLAILAEKMGAAAIDAIDYDEWCIENSKENIKANDCSKINLIKAETIAVDKNYDIILANINLNVILNNLAGINSVSKKDTFVLLSGFHKSDEPTILKALTDAGFIHLKTVQKNEWICLLAKMQ